MLRNRRLVVYVVISGVFWLSAWAFWGGTGTTGSSTTHLGWQGAALNALLLVPLFKGSGLARSVLIVQAIAAGVFIASLGVPPFGPSFGILAFVALAQVALLLPIGSAPVPAVKRDVSPGR